MIHRSRLAIAAALAGSLLTSVAFADSASPSDGGGSYDYYSLAQPSASGAPAATPTAQLPASAESTGDRVIPVSNFTPAASADYNSAGEGGATSGSDCNSGCGCDDCCHEMLPHLLHGGWKLQPLCCWNDCCPLTCPELTTTRLFDDCCWMKEHDTTLTGWIDGGFMGNPQNPTNHFNGPVTFTDRDDGQLNQFYGVLQRTPADMSKNCGLFIGGDIDFFWGSDYFFTTAAGLDGTKIGNVPRWYSQSDRQYGYAMPQAYVETDYDDLKIKWGHFYTIIGYEVVPAVGNFFYTHSYTMQYGEPFTHTGMLASRNIDDNWSWSAGVVAGWNDFDLEDGAQFMGGITYADKDYGSLSFSIISGNESDINVPGVGPESNRTMYSLVWSRNLTSRWTYVLQHDLGVQQNTEGFNAVDSKRADWYGVNQYLFYKINCCWTFGWRFEWFDDPQGYVVTGLRPGNTDARFRFPGSFYETSVGLDYKPNGNVTFRGELRYDWYDGQGGFTSPAVPGAPPNQPYNDNLDKNQLLLGVDMIVQF